MTSWNLVIAGRSSFYVVSGDGISYWRGPYRGWVQSWLYVVCGGRWALVTYYGMDMLIRLVSQTIIESLSNTFNKQLHEVCSFSSHECCPSPGKIHRDIIHILQSQT
jgi:hypothetical protein